MAARLNVSQDERTRSAIKTSQLVNRLQGFALSLEDPQTKKPVQMTKEQVSAALGLIRKTLPDLAVTTLQGDGGGPVMIVTGVLRETKGDVGEDD